MEKAEVERIIESTIRRVKKEDEDTYLILIEKFLGAYVFLATLGAQITFSLIISDIADPASVDNLPDDLKAVIFPVHKVRVLVAISWLFFTWTLAIASFCSFLLLNPKVRNSIKSLEDEAKRKNRNIFAFATVTFYLNVQPLSAFLLLSLVVSAYVPSVGWLGAVATTLFTLLTVAVGPWAFQGVTGRSLLFWKRVGSDRMGVP